VDVESSNVFVLSLEQPPPCQLNALPPLVLLPLVAPLLRGHPLIININTPPLRTTLLIPILLLTMFTVVLISTTLMKMSSLTSGSATSSSHIVELRGASWSTSNYHHTRPGSPRGAFKWGWRGGEPYNAVLEAAMGYAGACSMVAMDDLALVNKKVDTLDEGLGEEVVRVDGINRELTEWVTEFTDE